jgi:hypothetical protein
METSDERRRRLMDICIKSSSRTAVVDIKPEDREMLEQRRAIKAKPRRAKR